MDFRDLHKVGDGLSSWDVKQLIVNTFMYTLSEDDLRNVLHEMNQRLRFIEEQKEQYYATRLERWWAPHEAHEMMPYHAQCLVAGVTSTRNPKGEKNMIRAIKYLREIGTMPVNTLAGLKELCDAYKWELRTGQCAPPQPEQFEEEEE